MKKPVLVVRAKFMLATICATIPASNCQCHEPPPPVSGGFVLSSYKTPPICLLPGPGLASSLAIYPRGSTTRLGCHLRPTVVMLMPRPHSAVEWCQSSTGRLPVGHRRHRCVRATSASDMTRFETYQPEHRQVADRRQPLHHTFPSACRFRTLKLFVV